MTFIPSKSFLNFADYFSYSGIDFFDTPDFTDIPQSDDDLSITVDQSYLGRLDLIAYDYLGDANLWWIIALANGIEVIPSGMKLGQILRVPSSQSVTLYMSRAVKK